MLYTFALRKYSLILHSTPLNKVSKLISQGDLPLLIQPVLKHPITKLLGPPPRAHNLATRPVQVNLQSALTPHLVNDRRRNRGLERVKLGEFCVCFRVSLNFFPQLHVHGVSLPPQLFEVFFMIFLHIF